MASAPGPGDATQRHIDIVAADLPLHCPLPSQTLWDAHPRVYLPMDKTGEARCPYCGTSYRLKDGAGPAAH